MGEATRRVGLAVFWSVFARGGRFVMGIASSIIVVRGLGEHDYGVLSLVRILLAFVVILAGAGLGQSLLKFLPVFRVAHDAQGARSLARKVFAIQMIIWLALVGVGYASAGWFESFFDIEGLAVALWVGVALSIFELSFRLITHILNAHYDTKLWSIANFVSHAVFIAVLLVVLPRGWGVIGVLVAGAAGNAAAAVMLVGKVLSLFPRSEEEAVAEPLGSVRWLRFSLPFALIGVLNLIVWRQSETLFLAHFRGPEVTGFFDLAYRIPQTILEFVPGTVWPLVMAGISEAYAKNPANLGIAVARYYKALFLLSAPMCLFGVAIGGRMIPILFGDAMSPAAVPTQMFFAILTVSFLATPLSMALYVMEKSHVNLVVYVGLAIVNVGLDLILIPRYGLVGAVIPVAFVIFLSPFVYKRVVNRFVAGVDIPYRFIAKCFAASSPVLLILPIAGYVRGVIELAIVSLAAFFVVVVAYKKARVVGEEERELLASIPFPAASRVLKFIST